MSVDARDSSRSASLDRPVEPEMEPDVKQSVSEDSAPKIEEEKSELLVVKDSKAADGDTSTTAKVSLSSQTRLLAENVGSAVVPRISLRSRIFKAEHLYSMLGYRVRITHPPKKDKASETLVGKAGIIVAVLKRQKMLRLHLDDGREVDLKRQFIRVDNNADIPVDIYLSAKGLANLDM